MELQPPLWILKSEPETYSWNDLCDEGVAMWDGVRNHQAKANLSRMKHGDLAYFYHSGKARALVGVVEVVREAYPDPTDDTDRWLAIDVRAIARLRAPLDLKTLKTLPQLGASALVRQARLSVIPLSDGEAQEVATHLTFERM